MYIDFLSCLGQQGTFQFGNFSTSCSSKCDETENKIMIWAKLLVVFSSNIIVFAFNDTGSGGCSLIIPKNVQQKLEPQPETGPLLLHVVLRIVRIRDIPDGGGSYGLDFV